MTIVDLFRAFRHVRERQDEPNAGMRVEAIQRWCGGRKGDSWCCYIATMVLDLWFCGILGLESPVPRLGACDDVLNLARKNGWIRESPAVGDLYLFVRDPDGPAGPRGMEDAYHIGMVTDVGNGTFVGISGNTSEDGLSANGTGVFERQLELKPGKHLFVRYPGERAA